LWIKKMPEKRAFQSFFVLEKEKLFFSFF